MQTLHGFIKLHRKLLHWGWYQDNTVKSVFLHLLLTASFRDAPWRDITIKKGQLVTSYGQLANELGISVRQVRTALSKLKSTGEVTCASTNKYTVITLINWKDYQGAEEEPANNRQTTGKQPASNWQHRKNGKNIKNEKKYSAARPLPPGFSTWEQYEAHVAQLRR